MYAGCTLLLTQCRHAVDARTAARRFTCVQRLTVPRPLPTEYRSEVSHREHVFPDMRKPCIARHAGAELMLRTIASLDALDAVLDISVQLPQAVNDVVRRLPVAAPVGLQEGCNLPALGQRGRQLQ